MPLSNNGIFRSIVTSRLSLAAALIRAAWWQRAVTRQGDSAFIPRCLRRTLTGCVRRLFLLSRVLMFTRRPQFRSGKSLPITPDLVEPLSLDEAYLDVSDVDVLQGSATLIAKAIKEKIKQHIGLIASAGVSYNKFLAKLASDIDKPDGFYLITPEQGPEFAEKLPISQFHGIGKVTAAKMQALGIETGKDLRQLSLIVLQQHFGKAAAHYYNICRGIDHRPVNSHRLTKSVGVETTFQQDITSRQEILWHLQELLEKALQRAAEKQLAAYTLTVKIKYHNFVQITRSRTLPYTVTKEAELLEELIKNTGVGESSVRLLGVTLSSLDNKPIDNRFQQTDLFRNF